MVLRLAGPVALTCAGRTDAGVHARGQVCHVDLPAGAVTDGGAVLTRRLARVLPPDLVVRSVSPAPVGFDARFAAVWRRYCYRLVDGDRPPDPLIRRSVAHTRQPLDLDRLNEAAAGLLGLQDFAAFCRRRDGATTVRTLLACEARRVARVDPTTDAGGDAVVELTVTADAFCHSMVRSLTGALVRVGSGDRDPGWPAAVAWHGAETGGRDSSVPVMPAHGLTLEEVGYPDDDRLLERQRAARAVRTLN